MATHGLIRRWDTLRGSLALNATHVRTTSDWETISAGALVSYNTPNTILKVIELALGIEAHKAGTGVIGSVDENQYLLKITLLGVNETYSGAFDEAADTRVEIDNVALYNKASGTCWELYWGEIRWYINGSLHWSDPSGGSVEGTSGMLTPASIPLNGVPPTLSGSAAVNPAIALGVPPNYNFTQNLAATVDGDVTGGWEVKIGSTWYQLLVEVDPLPAPGVECGVTANLEFPEADNTNDGTCPIYARQAIVTTMTTEFITECTNGPAIVVGEAEVYQTQTERKSLLTSVGLWPNLVRVLRRINNDYRNLIVRGGFPELAKQSRSVCFDYVTEEIIDDQYDSEIVKASQSNYLEEVTNAAAAIVTVLSGDNESPYGASAFSFRGRSTEVVVITPASCPLVEPEEPPGEPVEPWPIYSDAISNSKSSVFPVVQERTGVGGNPKILPYLDHTDGETRYFNTWCNPFWSFVPYLPANTYFDVTSLSWKQTLWKVFDVGIETEYWASTRSQWCAHPDLPGARGSRNHFILDLLSDGALQTYTESVFGIPSSYLGCCRFDIQEWRPESEYQTTGANGWTGVDCTLGFSGTQITITPDLGKTAIVVKYAIGGLAYAPYELLHLFETITVDHEATNLTSIKYFLEGQNGEKIQFATEPGTYQRPAGVDSKYAGSHGQEFGCGFITNAGSDAKASGISVPSMANSQRSHHLQLLFGWDAAYVRVELNVTGVVRITQPGYTMPGSAGTVVQENGQMASVLYPRSGARWGNRLWWDGASLQTTPIPSVKGLYHPTMLDALCERRVMLEGVERSDGLLSEIALFLDPIEGQTIEAADTNTFSCLIFPNPAVDADVFARALFVNTLREVPPLAAWPIQKRNPTTLIVDTTTSDFEQAVFSYVQDYTRYASARNAAHLKDGGDTWTSPSASLVCANWAITEHRREVDNNENLFSIVRGDGLGGTWAYGRPWDGYHEVLDDSGAGAGATFADPHNCHAPSGQYCAVHVEDGKVRFRRSNSSTPATGWAVDVLATNNNDARYPKIAYCRKDGALYLYYSRDSLGSYLRISHDEGSTWSDEVAVISGGTHTSSCTTPDGAVILASVAGGKLAAKAKGSGDLALSAQFNFKDESGVDLIPNPDYGFGLSYEPAGTAGILLHVRISGEVASSHWICTDWGGPTWAMSFKRIG